MNSPEEPITLPLDYATELAMELHLMRAECSDAAESLIGGDIVDYIGLEECAVLDEALARAQRVLQGAIGQIQHLRAQRGQSAG
jgi:hypothetical protein